MTFAENIEAVKHFDKNAILNPTADAPPPRQAAPLRRQSQILSEDDLPTSQQTQQMPTQAAAPSPAAQSTGPMIGNIVERQPRAKSQDEADAAMEMSGVWMMPVNFTTGHLYCAGSGGAGAEGPGRQVYVVTGTNSCFGECQ